MTRPARTGASHFSAFSTFQRIKSLYEALEQVRRQSVSQRTTWCCLHAAAPRRVPTGGSMIHITSFIMLHHSLRQQLNVLLHLAWENMLRCIPVWWGRDFFFSLYLSLSGGEEVQRGLNLLMDSSVFNNYRWSRGRCHSRLKYLDLTCMDSHCMFFFYGGDICNIQRMSRMSPCDPLWLLLVPP